MTASDHRPRAALRRRLRPRPLTPHTGTQPISGGRLYTIAQALGVEVAFFYEGIGAPPSAGKPTEHQRLLLELTRNFVAIADRRQQEAICNLTRSLAATSAGPVQEDDVTADDELARVA